MAELRFGESYRITKEDDVIEFKVIAITSNHYQIQILITGVWMKGAVRLLNKKSKLLNSSDYFVQHIPSKLDQSVIDLYIEMALQTRDKEWFNELMSQREVLIS